MNNFFKIGILFLFCFNISCSVANTDSSGSKMPTRPALSATDGKIAADVFFEASGTEPFWSIELSEKQVKLKMISDSITAPYVEAIRAADHNVKSYRTKSKSNDILNIQIVQNNCANEMSGKISPYSVSVEYQKKGASKLEKITGCGNYITDYRLNDIWVLETLNENKAEKKDFSNELPLMEINSATNSFSGFSGCNRMTGELFFEKGLLRFTDVATTKMMCASNNQENTFLKAMKSTTTYKIENNRLWLSNPSGLMLIFKKID